MLKYLGFLILFSILRDVYMKYVFIVDQDTGEICMLWEEYMLKYNSMSNV